ncbi:DUF6884 domain-containing protein [Streptomyces sp. NPDC048384]|uniref:DUF6884 domain-containing protein n=1 Tax=Streptomyces sp. NPDC048384 TaxID=3155487 RepID=UPI0034327F50
MAEKFKRLPDQQHQAVLTAAQRPDHLIPGIEDGNVPKPVTFNKRTLVAVHRAGLGDMRPSAYFDREGPYEDSGASLFLTPAGRSYARQFGVPCQRRKVVVLQCGEKKAEPSWEKYHYRGVIPAGQLYIGPYHRSLRLAASALTNPYLTWIMSAFHGLVPLKRPLGRYDVKLGDPRSLSAERMGRHTASLDLADADVIFLGSKDYADLFTESVPHALAPLSGDLLAQRSQCKTVRESPDLVGEWWVAAAARR